MVNILWNVKTVIYNVLIGENVKIMKILTYKHLFRLSKKHYIDKKIKDSGNNIKETWKIINSHLNKSKDRNNYPTYFQTTIPRIQITTLKQISFTDIFQTWDKILQRKSLKWMLTLNLSCKEITSTVYFSRTQHQVKLNLLQ